MFWTRKPSFISVDKHWNKHWYWGILQNLILTGVVKLSLYCELTIISPLSCKHWYPPLPLQLELCQKIEDETLRLVIWNGDKIVTTLIYSPFYFAWVKDKQPCGASLIIQTTVTACCGWCVQCNPWHFIFSQCVFSYTATNSITLDTVEIPGPIKQVWMW